MTKVLGTVTLINTTGSHTISGLGITPKSYRITVADKSTGDTVARLSLGTAVGSTTETKSTYMDTTGGGSFSSANIIDHYGRVSGVIQAIYQATHTSYAAGQITVNTTLAATDNYQLVLEAEDS